jgi:hypothetical protein
MPGGTFTTFIAIPDREQMLVELERWASELDRTATDLQVLRRQVFDLLMKLKTGDDA